MSHQLMSTSSESSVQTSIKTSVNTGILGLPGVDSLSENIYKTTEASSQWVFDPFKWISLFKKHSETGLTLNHASSIRLYFGNQWKENGAISLALFFMVLVTCSIVGTPGIDSIRTGFKRLDDFGYSVDKAYVQLSYLDIFVLRNYTNEGEQSQQIELSRFNKVIVTQKPLLTSYNLFEVLDPDSKLYTKDFSPSEVKFFFSKISPLNVENFRASQVLGYKIPSQYSIGPKSVDKGINISASELLDLFYESEVRKVIGSFWELAQCVKEFRFQYLKVHKDDISNPSDISESLGITLNTIEVGPEHSEPGACLSNVNRLSTSWLAVSIHVICTTIKFITVHNFVNPNMFLNFFNSAQIDDIKNETSPDFETMALFFSFKKNEIVKPIRPQSVERGQRQERADKRPVKQEVREVGNKPTKPFTAQKGTPPSRANSAKVDRSTKGKNNFVVDQDVKDINFN